MASSEKVARETMQRALALVKAAEPKAEARVSLTAKHVANTRFARNEITTGGDSDETKLTLRVAMGQRVANASTNQVDEAALKRLVERACAMARLAPENPEMMPVLGPQKYGQAKAFDEAIDRLDAAGRSRMVKDIIAVGKPDALAVAGFLEHSSSLVGLATSAGLLTIQPTTEIDLSITARTADATGSGYSHAVTRQLKALDVTLMATQACTTAKASKQPKRLEPGMYTAVLEPLAAAELAEFLADAMQARPTDEGRSFFSKPGGSSKEKEKLFSEQLSLRTDWSSPLTPGLPFDPDGLPLAPTAWVDRGVVQTLACSRYWAKKRGRTATGVRSGVVMGPGTSSREALIRGVKRGVLISRFWYTNLLDPVTLMLTGLTRDGLFLIENGEIVGAVNNFRFNQSIAEVFAKLDGADSKLSLTEDVSSRVPAFRTHDFHLASTSDAI